MKRSWIIGLFIISFLGVFLYNAFHEVKPRDIENAPEWADLEVALSEASATGRYVLVDIYEAGCQFCKAMDREVYPAPAVRNVLDQKFTVAKINGHSDDLVNFLGETMTQKEFAARMGATAYPFIVVLDSEGNVVNTRRGYLDIVSFTRFLNNSIEGV
ncbi:MAG: thioredoxin family protein [Balneolaceae bacterium]